MRGLKGACLQDDPTSFPPQGPPKPEAVPFPKEFQRVLAAEWAGRTLPKHKSKIWNKLYTLPVSVSQGLPAVALSSAAVIPYEGEGGPKETRG